MAETTIKLPPGATLKTKTAPVAPKIKLPPGATLKTKTPAPAKAPVLPRTEAVAPKVRRLNPGEYIQNPDGSRSTELSITVTNPRLNGGRATNIPSIWSIDGKPTKLDGPDMEDRSVDYALQSGETWNSYDSIEEAEAAARARSDAGGRFQDAQQVTPSRPVTFTRAPVRPTAPKPVNNEAKKRDALAMNQEAYNARGWLKNRYDELASGATGLQQGLAAGATVSAADEVQQLAQAYDAIDAGADIQETALKAAPRLLEQILAYREADPAIREAMRQRDNAYVAGQVGSVRQLRERQSTYARNPAFEMTVARLNAGDVDGAIDYFLQDPVGSLVSGTTQSLPGMAVGVAGGLAAGPGGLAGGAGLADKLSSLSSAFDQHLAAAGVDLNDDAAVARALQDPAIRQAIASDGNARAAIVGILEGMTGIPLSKLLIAGTAPVRRALVGGASEALYGAGGEALGEVAEGRTPQLGNVVAEGVLELPQTVVEAPAATWQSQPPAPPDPTRTTVKKFVEGITPPEGPQGRREPPPLSEAPTPPPPAPPAPPAPPGDGTKASPRVVETPEDLTLATSQAATSPMNGREEPTDAQKEAGNYKKAHVVVQGQQIAIENPKGSVRRSLADAPVQWESPPLPVHIGYFKDTEGADGDKLDVYIGDDLESDRAFIIDQLDPATGEFDEHKVIIAVPDMVSAIQAYDGTFQPGQGEARIGAVTEMSIEEMTAWRKAKGATKKALGDIRAQQARIQERLAEGAALPPPSSPAAAPAEEPAAPPPPVKLPKGAKLKPRKGWVSILGLAKKAGGIKDVGGDLKAMGVLRQRPGVINNRSGIDLDKFAEQLFQMPEWQDQLRSDSDPDKWDVKKLQELMRQELAGKAVVPRGEEAAQAERDQQRQEDEFRAKMRQDADVRARDLLGRDLTDEEFEGALKRYVEDGYDSMADVVTDILESEIIADVLAVEAESGQVQARSEEAGSGDRDSEPPFPEPERAPEQAPADEARGGSAREDQAAPAKAEPEGALGATVTKDGSGWKVTSPEGTVYRGTQGRPFRNEAEAKQFATRWQVGPAEPEAAPAAKEQTPEEVYEAARQEHNRAFAVFQKVRDDFRDRKIDADEFGRAAEVYKAATAKFDEAYRIAQEAIPDKAVKTETTSEGEQPVLLDLPKDSESAVLTQKARDAKNSGRMGATRRQEKPGGMFAPPEEPAAQQIDLEEVTSESRSYSQNQPLQDGSGRPVYQTAEQISAAIGSGELRSHPDRVGQCYRYAAREAWKDKGGHYVIATVEGARGKRIYHAVLIRDRLLYDPVYDRWFDPKAYSDAVGGLAIMHWMTPRQVMEYGQKTGHYPDWQNQGLPPAETVKVPAEIKLPEKPAQTPVRTQGRGRPDLVIDTKPKGPETEAGKKLERSLLSDETVDIFEGDRDPAVTAEEGHDLTEGEVKEVKRFMEIIGDQYLGDIEFAFRKSGDDSPFGISYARQRLVEIFSEAVRRGQFTETMVHELWHQLTRHLPKPLKKAVQRTYRKAADAYLAKHPQFRAFHDTMQMYLEGEDAREFLKHNPTPAKEVRIFGNKSDGTVQMVAWGDDAAYRFINPDEYFAETMTDVTMAKLDSENEQVNALWKAFRQIYREIVYRLQRIFGGALDERIWRGYAERQFTPQATSGMIGWQDRAEVPAWHGTPTKGIKRFSTDYIGTGEGAQAYGWGLYFATNKAIADHYRRKLSGGAVMVKGLLGRWRAFEPTNEFYSDAAIVYIKEENYNIDKTIARLQSRATEFDKMAEPRRENEDAETKAVRKGWTEKANGIRGDIARLEKIKDSGGFHRNGALYLVELAPTEDQYLDWDKPLSEQSQFVKDAIDKIHPIVLDTINDGLENQGNNGFEGKPSEESEYTGRDLYMLLRAAQGRDSALAEAMGVDDWRSAKEGASKYLLSLGIRGNRYLDANSRTGARDDVNYVIFDDKDISIAEDVAHEVRRFGNPLAPNQAIQQGGQQVQIDILKHLHRQGWRANMERRLRSWRQIWQDRFATMADIERYLMGVTGQAIPANRSFYKAEETFTGKVGDRMQQFHEGMLKELYDAMAASGLKVREIEKYLVALHAPERNATIAAINPNKPDAGAGTWDGQDLTNAYAQQIIDDFRNRGLLPKLAPIAAAVRKIRMFDLNTRVAAGLIPAADVAQKMRDWPNYVPLRGVEQLFTDDELITQTGPRLGSGYNVKNREYRTAMGRSSEAQNILAHLISQAEESIVRAEKNKVMQVLASEVLNYPDDTFWKVDMVTTKRTIDPNTGLVTAQATRMPSSEDEDSHVIHYKVNGQLHRVWIANPRLVANIKNMHANELPAWTKAFRIFATIFRAVNVNANPEFILPNAGRDLQTALVQSLQHNAPGIKRKLIKYWPQAMAASWGGYKGKAGPRDSWIGWYRRMARAGGKVDFFNVDDIEGMVSNINGEMRRRSGKPLAHAENALRGIYHLVDRANHAVENAVRLAAFRACVEAGFSDADAASVAKNITVNFNRRGEVSQWFNLLWPFFNAAVQGTFTLGKAAARSKYVRRALVGITLAGLAEGLANSLASAGGEDDESDYDKVPDYLKRKNIIIMNPGYPDNGAPPYWTIPLGYGLNVFYGAGRELADVMLGKKTAGDALGNVGISAADAFIPVDIRIPEGTQETLAGLSPALTAPVADVAINKDFTGQPIYREPTASEKAAGIPESQITRPGTNEFWKDLARELNDWSGGNDYEPGLFDLHPETMEHLVKTYAGGLGTITTKMADLIAPEPGDTFELGKVPVVRKVIGYFPKRGESNRYWDNKAEIMQAEGRLKAAEENDDIEAIERLEQSGERRLGLAQDLKQTEKRLKKLRKEAREIQNDDTMTDADKRAELTAIYAEMDVESKEFNRLFYQEVEKPEQLERSPVVRPAFDKAREDVRARLEGEF